MARIIHQPCCRNVSSQFHHAHVAMLTSQRFYNHTDWDVNIKNQRLMTETLIPQLSQLIPGQEYAYLNEGDLLEPEWQKVFYGESYTRLLEVKRTYDPTSLWYARTAVGSEAWEELEGGRLCRTE
jgi:hypothetical protein